MKGFELAGLVVLASLVAGAAEAKPARCFTTDDGHYDCDFQTTDDAGSFVISAPMKPTFELLIDRPGFAYGLADFGTGNVSLPGVYIRQSDDPACWSNPETATKICAW